MKAIFIESLTKLLNESISDGTSFNVWKSKVINILTRIYGEKSKHIDQINSITYKTYSDLTLIGINRNSSSFGGGNNLETCRKTGFALVNGFIEEIEVYGLPEKNEKKQENSGLNIVLNQSNSQNMSVSLNLILTTLKEELSGKQFKEIQDIINTTENIESKKKKLFEKFKSFGTDLLTNIIANILTNPQMYN